MLQFSAAFGERVQQILKETRQTPDSVEQISQKGISHMTVRRMSRGSIPGSDHIIEFADAVARAMEWDLAQRKHLADELLALAESRARYHASVTYGRVVEHELCRAAA